MNTRLGTGDLPIRLSLDKAQKGNASVLPISKRGTFAMFANRLSAVDDYEHITDSQSVDQIMTKDKIVIIDDKLFLAECLRIVLQETLQAPVEIYPSIERISSGSSESRLRLVLMSIDSLKTPDITDLIRRTAAVVADAPIVVLSYSNELKLVREVLDCGVKGYIPMTMGCAVAIEAVKFVLAGGTYVPAESVRDAEPELRDTQKHDPFNGFTSREMSVIRAIQQGKSNKIIAFDLSVCESTVKVHIRNIMKKLRAKNRTEVAVRFFAPGRPA